MRILVDTNVFLDLFLDRGENAYYAGTFFDYCVQHKHQILLSTMSLRDIEYVAHKYTHDKNASKRIQHSAYELCNKVIDISADDAINALFSEVNDFEDSLLIEAAEREHALMIVTSNEKDFSNSKVAVMSTKEFCQIIEKAS